MAWSVPIVRSQSNSLSNVSPNQLSGQTKAPPNQLNQSSKRLANQLNRPSAKASFEKDAFAYLCPTVIRAANPKPEVPKTPPVSAPRSHLRGFRTPRNFLTTKQKFMNAQGSHASKATPEVLTPQQSPPRQRPNPKFKAGFRPVSAAADGKNKKF